MNPPDLIQSSAPHLVGVDEGSRDAKGRKSHVVEAVRQPAVNSDEMADAMDAANRKKMAFSADAAPHAGTKESINPDVEVKKASVSEPADQDRPVIQPTLPNFKVAQPLSIQIPHEEVSANAVLSAVSQTTSSRYPEPDQDISARLDTLKAQNNAVRTSLDALDSKSLARV